MRRRPPQRIVKARCHPLVRALLDLCREQQICQLDVADRAGLGRSTIRSWRLRYMPAVDLLDAALNVLGYRLAIVPIDCTRPQDVARWERVPDVPDADMTHKVRRPTVRARQGQNERSEGAEL